ncbi:MAG: beta-ketoacyl synthase N-terminal-like domain-containing protein, partial [Myxococcota bacterium]
MSFEPIAIVGRACHLPGATSPQALWEAVLARKDLTTPVAPTRWRVGRVQVRGTPDDAADRTWSERGGYVDAANTEVDLEGFRLSASALAPLDPLVHWLVHTGREATRDAGFEIGDPALARAGAIVGNLSFPTAGMARFAERTWLGDAWADAGDLPPADPRNRFMSGLPAHLLASALGLGGRAF